MIDCSYQDAPEIIQAIFAGDQSVFRFPLNNEEINYRDSQRRTPLHAAAHCGETEIVETLIKQNSRINAKDAKWYTPLHRACASKAASVVKV